MEVIVSLMLAFASGVSLGFTGGRIFERWEFMRKGYRISEDENEYHRN